ncbi:Yip1 domain protein [Thalassovita gelatinovora]|uniref:Yip1 domain protein n=1 Tax=Thalassovita gelatinovora TaxID=53501 RepID=A0A0P1FQG8_THAGE|nr:Yip1 family protein [Thalassovita gelatinovora]QIZ79438.1 YIP1 family protein [Thalassovita gelatinovora]CUH62803.1 Yip1 domain protein [Thalassovita gelatinovora]SEQ10449.1 Yip1 domain-containing protein [Thalassovita gelatinovora]
MTLPDLKQLALETLRNPRNAARQILDMRLDSTILWTAMALIVVLNAILNGMTVPLLPLPETMPTIFASPWLFAVILGGGIVISTFLLTWVGRMLGGRADLVDILALIVWLQALRLVMQAFVFALFFFSTLLSDLVALAAGLYGLWITIAFLDEAQGFGSIFKAILVLVLTMLGLAFGLSFFLLLIGASSAGLT